LVGFYFLVGSSALLFSFAAKAVAASLNVFRRDPRHRNLQGVYLLNRDRVMFSQIEKMMDRFRARHAIMGAGRGRGVFQGGG
jgi:hypothetical protein